MTQKKFLRHAGDTKLHLDCLDNRYLLKLLLIALIENLDKHDYGDNNEKRPSRLLLLLVVIRSTLSLMISCILECHI